MCGFVEPEARINDVGLPLIYLHPVTSTSMCRSLTGLRNSDGGEMGISGSTSRNVARHSRSAWEVSADQTLRRPVLYPTELRARRFSVSEPRARLHPPQRR